MVRIKIGDYEKKLDNIDECWINQTINGYRKEKIPLSVHVIFEEGSLNMVLSAPPPKSSFIRKPRGAEIQICNLWNEVGLNNPEFTGGNLIAFIKQLKKILR